MKFSDIEKAAELVQQAAIQDQAQASLPKNTNDSMTIELNPPSIVTLTDRKNLHSNLLAKFPSPSLGRAQSAVINHFEVPFNRPFEIML